MLHPLSISPYLKGDKIGKLTLYIAVVLVVFLVAIGQDFIQSRLKDTGFYLSESALYNSFWAFIIPLTLLVSKLAQKLKSQTRWLKVGLIPVLSLANSLLHCLMFTLFFVGMSNILFSPAHQFSHMFGTVLSNQFYIIALWYAAVCTFHLFVQKTVSTPIVYNDTIQLKSGSKLVNIPVSTIQMIVTDKPYSAIITDHQKLLDAKTLKDFEQQLDPNQFLRVHRSSIINANAITQLQSRSNGDYDATLKNGEMIRLSRHYRTNWQQLLQ